MNIKQNVLIKKIIKNKSSKIMDIFRINYLSIKYIRLIQRETLINILEQILFLYYNYF